MKETVLQSCLKSSGSFLASPLDAWARRSGEPTPLAVPLQCLLAGSVCIFLAASSCSYADSLLKIEQPRGSRPFRVFCDL